MQTLSCAAHNCDILVDDENVMYVFLKCRLIFIKPYFSVSFIFVFNNVLLLKIHSNIV